jgi:hypothetical protein
MEDAIVTEMIQELIEGNIFVVQVIVLEKSCWVSLSQCREDLPTIDMGGLVVSMPTRFDTIPVRRHFI